MDTHESDKGGPTPSASTAVLPAPSGDVTPKTACAADKDALESEAPKSAAEAAAADIAKTEAAEEPKIELWITEAPTIAPSLDQLETAGKAAATTAGDEAKAAAEPGTPPMNRFTQLAASLVLAAMFGGILGAVATASLVRSGPVASIATGRTGLEEFQALKEQVVQARVDLAALKVSIDAGNRSTNAHFTRIGERIDRIERNQVEPAAKLNKALDALERLTRTDATGTIAPPGAGAAGRPGALDGWVLRDVRRGTALIEGRMGVIEVDQGDIVPGLGRVESIRKQDGRWVVVTSKGLIMPPR